MVDGTDLLVMLFGVSIAGVGLESLADLYAAVGRDAEAERIRRTSRVADVMTASDSLEMENSRGTVAGPVSSPSRARDEAATHTRVTSLCRRNAPRPVGF